MPNYRLRIGTGFSDAVSWAVASAGPSVVWNHNFDFDDEVTNFELGVNPIEVPIPMQRVLDESGDYCLEQLVIGATFAANYTAGDSTLTVNDASQWPDPATYGSYYVVACKKHGEGETGGVGYKNLFLITAKSGNVLTVTRTPYAISAFASTAQSYTTGDYIGAGHGGEWRRTFSALPAGENGKDVNDLAAAGAVPIRSKLSGNAYSVPFTSIWQYGFYGHTDNQTLWDDWTPWVGATTYGARGVSQGAEDKYRLWDGDEYWIRFDQRIKDFWEQLSQPASSTAYWGRKSWAVQSEISGTGQIVAGIVPSNIFGIPSTNESPFSFSTYKASRVFGVTDYSRADVSYQPNSPWDVAPHYANLSSSGKPSTGCPTPDGSSAWENKADEWVTFLLHVKPGRSGENESTVEVFFARPNAPGYTGTYTPLVSLTDARIVYSGSSDDDYPDGAMSYPTMPKMDALPGHQAFGLMGYFNTFQSVDIAPPAATYSFRLKKIIFSKAYIPPPIAE